MAPDLGQRGGGHFGDRRVDVLPSIGVGSQFVGRRPRLPVDRSAPPPRPHLLGHERQEWGEQTQQGREGQPEGMAGRFGSSLVALVGPVLDQFDMVVGGYTDTTDLMNDLEIFQTYSDTALGKKWVSVFGTENPKALMPAGSNFVDDTLSAEVNRAGEVICRNCPKARMKGSDEWLDLFNREEMVSPFQDGHYIYIVIPGSGSGEDVVAPRICVADGESPKFIHKMMDL